MRKMGFVVICGLFLVISAVAFATSLSDLPAVAQNKILSAMEHRNTVRQLPLGVWQQLAELSPSDSQANDFFGISVAISGNTIVVGDFNPNTEQYGEVDVFVKPASGWSNMTQTARLTSSDNGQGFGISVAVDGNTVVVGAANTSNFKRPGAAGPGAAYVFVKPAGGWVNMTETAKLTASDGQSGDAFGDSVSINGNTIAAGAFFVSNFSGKAYVFVKPSTGWSGNLTQTAELAASDSDGILDYFGCSVAVSGNTVAVGSYGHNNFQGASYVFVEPAGGWVNMTETAELTVSNGKSSDFFGFAVAINGNTIVAGAPSAYNQYGVAYVYLEPASGWTSTSQFTAGLGAPDATQGDSFGQSVGISDNGHAIVVGAPAATINGNFGQGAVYAYLRPAAGWSNTQHAYAEATASDGAANDGMAVSIGISGATVIAGAPKNNKPGATYVFGQ